MDDIKVLTARRGRIKASLTFMRNFIDRYDPETGKIFDIKVRNDRLETLYSEFADIQASICAISEESDSSFEDFENEYYYLKSKCEDFLNYTNSSQNSSSLGLPKKQDTINLPKLSLPTFEGKIENWTSFFDLFKSTIHNNADLADIQKFYYLKSSLKGEPLDIISSLPLTQPNYVIAIDLLTERYSNKKLIVNSHLKALFNLPNASSVASLKHLLDTANVNIRALKGLGYKTEEWDILLVHMLSSKLDQTLRTKWELHNTTTEPASYAELETFLKQYIQALDVCVDTKPKSNALNVRQVPVKVHSTEVNIDTSQCPVCSKSHGIFNCPDFLKLKPYDRLLKVKQLHRCINCLSSSHKVNSCNSSKCKVCAKPHNTLLHIYNYKSEISGTAKENPDEKLTHKQAEKQPSSEMQSNSSKVLSTGLNCSSTVLLSTAMIDVRDSTGEYQKCRALLDSGSEGSFISESCFQRLGLQRNTCNVPVCGVGETHAGYTRGFTDCTVKTKSDIIQVKLYVMKKLTSVPSHETSTNKWPHIANLQLADPFFYKPGKIDVILGADVYASLMLDGTIKGPPGTPLAINSKLGYLLLGEISFSHATTNIHSFRISVQNDLNTLVENFWKSEELQHESKSLSEEEVLCEQHFVKTHSRDDSGRFCVSLPFKPSIKELGDSRSTALGRFYRMEASLDDNTHKDYVKFIDEYQELEHMQLTSSTDLQKESSQLYYYLPHHPVHRPSSTTTKLRVVFDGSCKTSTGSSLNDHLYTGPKLQVDIVILLTRFRLNKIVLTADIEKFFRQISVSKSDQAFQRILWRASKKEPIQSYDLCTITYGTSCAPYLSIRCLRQLAADVKSDFPNVSRVLEEDFYVDDLLTGANSVEEAKQLKEQLTTVMNQAKFTLHKWCSNSEEIVTNHMDQSAKSLNLDSSVKLLGLLWSPNEDDLSYSIDLSDLPVKITKRVILSEIAKLFDPLGLLCPIIVKAKLIMQKTWLCNMSWDEQVPDELAQDFSDFRNSLSLLKGLRIPRTLILFGSDIRYELFGFCDASENAIAAVIYLRSVSSTQIKVSLVCAKSKVSPLEKTTIPRLELCGAVLLSNLVEKIKPFLQVNDTYLFTDSNIVLAWIAREPSTWKLFVNKRVSVIQSKTEKHQWHHVRSQENPADIASRGATTEKFLNDDKWWQGPSWLLDPNYKHETEDFKNDISDLPEIRNIKCSLVTQENDSCWYLKYSSYLKTIRVTAYCLRFIKIHKENISLGPLSVQEMKDGLICIVKHIQSLYFMDDIKNIKLLGNVKKNSKLSCLNPFIDSSGVLRVGGRIHKSNKNYDAVHQIILPLKHQFVTLLLIHTHEVYCHAGIQFMMNTLRQKFWLVGNVRCAIRNVIRKCNQCIRFKATPTYPQMGNLPSPRVTLTRPFYCTGCDYAGPFMIKQMGGRSRVLNKTYLVIFICLSIKAVHLELVTDLSTETFIAALNRFICRRGLPLHIYSDNGTNFVGANNSLMKFFKENGKHIQEFTSSKSINWHFIPPNSPHMGGIWESAVKSAKHHLKRVIGDHILNFEELNTLIIQVEAILNSRPICKLSNDQSEIDILTPGHFLTGDSLISLPEQEISGPINYNRRWKLVQRLRREFWKRWQNEYLHTLQQRNKWKFQEDNIQIGDVVLIKEDNLPPMKYTMGIIEKTFPGEDNITRVVEVKTNKGTLKRPVAKLIRLPANESV